MMNILNFFRKAHILAFPGTVLHTCSAMDLRFRKHSPRNEGPVDVLALLTSANLSLDQDISMLISAHTSDGTLVGCGGVAGDIIKAVAIAPDFRAKGMELPLMTEIVSTAWEFGEKDLFLYATPDNEEVFSRCGFIPLARVPGAVVLMENNRQRLLAYCESLKSKRAEGANIAGLVMDSAPFTMERRCLIETAAAENDRVHLFLTREGCPPVPYEEYLAMVQENTQGISNLTIHSGSAYTISKAAFPGSRQHDAARERAYTGISMQLFRKYIAPALGITTCYVCMEPFSAMARQHTVDMEFWLTTDSLTAPALGLRQVHCTSAMAVQQDPAMTGPTASPQITLQDVLVNYEARAERQREIARMVPGTIVSFSLVMAGPTKDTPLARRIFEAGLDGMLRYAATTGWSVLHRKVIFLPTGPEALLALDAAPMDVKRAMVGIEETHALGRLFDLDVLDESLHPVSRTMISLPPRTCLICAQPAVECRRRGSHAAKELLAMVQRLYDAWQNGPEILPPHTAICPATASTLL